VFYSFDDYDRMSGMFTLRDTNVAINSYSDFVSNSNSFDRTSWLYDFSTGLLTNKLYADGNGTAYSYTSDGKLATRTWARGVVTTYSYTNTGEMIGIDYSDSTPDITFSYDRLGRQVTVTDAQGVRTFGYDPDTLQLTNEVIVSSGVTNIITRAQDSLGRSSGMDLNGVYDVDYGFDNQGRFLGLVATNGGVEVANVTYSYLADSDLMAGYSNSVSSVNSARGYEDNRNLLTAVDNRYGATLISGFAYENDAVGRRTDRIDSGSSTATNAFGYNQGHFI
jgi:YD repeat-containing protein